MKIKTILGIIVLTLFCNWKIHGQSYIPELIINNNQNLPVKAGGLGTIGTNEVNLRLDYQNSSLPSHAPFLPHNKYMPLEVCWEFIYKPSVSSVEKREYSFQQTPNVVFPIAISQETVTVNVWAIDAYKDDEPPPKVSTFDINYTGSNVNLNRNITESSLQVIPSWAPSRGDSLLYILRLEFDCEVTIEGKLTFDYGSFEQDVIETATISEGTLNTLTNKIEWNVKGDQFLDGATSASMKYRDFYVLFDVKDGASIGSEFACKASYISNVIAVDFCGDTMTVSRTDTIGTSHDPNIKSLLKPKPLRVNSPEVICMDNKDELITIQYKIEFQNIGDGAARQVTIEDWLDEKDHVHSVRFLDSEYDLTGGSTFNTSTGIYDPLTDGHLYWYFQTPGNGLRGTDEADYGIKFQEDSTKSWLAFEVNYLPTVLDTCSALMNHARITFDCNPEFYTTTTIAKITCSEGGTASTVTCPTCDEIIDRTIVNTELEDVGGIIKGYQLPTTILDEIDKTNLSRGKVNWYPDRWLEKSGTAEAIMRPLEDITYTLVVNSGGNNCERAVYKIIIDADDYNRGTPNNMHILDDSDPTDCTSRPIVIGGSPPLGYSWNSGSVLNANSKGPEVTISRGTKNYSLRVTDAHGCTVDFSTTITCKKRPIWHWLVGAILFFFLFIGIRKIIGKE